MSDQSSIQGCTNFKLRKLMRRVAQHYDNEMDNEGLKTTQFSLLTHVRRLGPIRPGELARIMAMDASTLTRNMKPLADAGWILVSAGPDGRTRTVTITDAGREKQHKALRHWKAAQESLHQLLGNDAVLALHALIDSSLTLLSDGPTAQADRTER